MIPTLQRVIAMDENEFDNHSVELSVDSDSEWEDIGDEISCATPRRSYADVARH